MKNRYILIMARSPQQAAQYAKRVDLPNFTYRAVANAKSIRGIQVADVHILPEFWARPDSHAIMSELRYGRDIVKYDVTMPDPIEAPAKDQGDGMGEQLSIDFTTISPAELTPVEEEEAFPAADMAKYEQADTASLAAVMDRVNDEIVHELQGEAAPAVVRTRRKRCRVCGRLAHEEYATDPEGHDVKAHTTQEFFS